MGEPPESAHDVEVSLGVPQRKLEEPNDGNLVTSQNPFSGDAFSRHYLEALASVPRRAVP